MAARPALAGRARIGVLPGPLAQRAALRGRLGGAPTRGGRGGRLIVGEEPASACLAEAADPADDAFFSPFSPLRRFDEPEAPGPKDGGRSGGGVTEVVPFFVS
ncbi:hypothetical protein [Actinomyces massiliensis]|uniref:hypothetical protein n=1 Tax=Actinomyces massiliensis TaxID=461393 RepID=UPI0002E052EA|nr:hypothetical protein [Actinomyces massiliensis]